MQVQDEIARSSGTEQFVSGVPYFKCFYPPSRGDAAKLIEALSSPDEKVVFKLHVVNTYGFHCAAIVTNRRLKIFRLSPFLSFMAWVLIVRLPRKIPVIGGILTSAVKLCESAWSNLTNKQQRMARKIDELDDRAVLDMTNWSSSWAVVFFGLIFPPLWGCCLIDRLMPRHRSILLHDIIETYSAIKLQPRSKSWFGSVENKNISFSGRGLFSEWRPLSCDLPSRGLLAVCKNYVDITTPYLETLGLQVRINGDEVSIQLP
jgi:hypothetical protein